MKLHLVSAYDVHPGLNTLLDCAALNQGNQYVLSESAEDADAIVFVENTQFDDLLFKRLLDHEWVKIFPGKVFMYNEMDRPWDVLPGVYTCIAQKHIDINRHRSFAYLSTPNKYIASIHEKTDERRWLFSFMGAMSHSCRNGIMQLSDEKAYLKDTSGFNVWNASDRDLDARAQDYASVLSKSHFVLCPRGIGTSSIRLYETLEAGRAPVIISDQWIPPDGTDWTFAVRVGERQVDRLPAMLEAMTDEAEQRGDAARAAWLASYAPESLFNSLGQAIESLMVNGKHMNKPHQLPWNKWIASGGLFARTAVQHLRGQR